MRVISGSAKGYGLKVPKHRGLRPTPSRVKEAIFSSFAACIPGARVLELFAGTGAFAIETLSQGAAFAVLVEKDGRAASLIEQNLKKTHLQEKARLVRGDVRQALEWLGRDTEVFDMIFADPPYDKTISKKEETSWLNYLLQSPRLPSLLAPDGVLLIEYFKKQIPVKTDIWKAGKDFKFGDTIVTMFRQNRGS